MGNCVSCSRRPAVVRIPAPSQWANETGPITRAELNERRVAFWAKPPSHATPEIWQALKSACLAMLVAHLAGGSFVAQSYLDNAGLRRQFADLSVIYDKKGHKYDLPSFLQSDPTNLIPSN